MLCLYCEAELTTFRGLFDEDFCCREHRDKYFYSFRKGLTMLPVEAPPEAQTVPESAAAESSESVATVETTVSSPALPDPSVADFVPMPTSPALGARPILATAGPLVVPAAEIKLPLVSMVLELAPPLAAPIEVAPTCRQLVSRPVAAGEIAFAHEICSPMFVASLEAMQPDEAPGSGRDQTPEVAPAMLVSSAPLDRPMSSAGSPQFMPPPLAIRSSKSGLSPAHQNAPGFSSAVPNVATEAPARQDATPSSAGPRAHQPLRPTFGNFARIKRWRLRITFAKPA